jgi:NADPH:quinone reductase-like Zn-dependent oxidoreductase
MKAIVQETYGTTDVLRLADIEQPTPGSGEVLLRVQAASAHIGDWHFMTGLPYLFRIAGSGVRRPRLRVRGTDVAGLVEANGQGVTRFGPGDAVFGVCTGAFAEFATARQDKIAPTPENLTFQQAATVPTSASTALQALRDAGNVQPGQRVPSSEPREG